MSNSLVPLIAFFVAFVIAFSLIELLIIYILNRLEKKHWAFVIDTLIRAKVHHAKAIEMIALAGILLVLAFVFFTTPFLEIMKATTPILMYFSIVLLVAMIVVYAITARKLTIMALEKKVHRYIYFVISIIIFTFMMIIADQSYNSYQNYINQQFVDPAAQQIRAGIDQREESRLLTQFKEDYLSGRCEIFDYNEEGSADLTHFIYIETDLELASRPGTPVADPGSLLLKGYKCTDGENTFLLTEEGKWYWVISE